jgi:hypothetical protein
MFFLVSTSFSRYLSFSLYQCIEFCPQKFSIIRIDLVLSNQAIFAFCNQTIIRFRAFRQINAVVIYSSNHLLFISVSLALHFLSIALSAADIRFQTVRI